MACAVLPLSAFGMATCCSGSVLNRCCCGATGQISLQSVLVYFWGCVVAASPCVARLSFRIIIGIAFPS